MRERAQINGSQLLILLVLIMDTTSILFLPSSLARQSQQDMWLVPLLVPTIIGLMVVYFTWLLARRFPQKDFVQALPLIVGRIPGKILQGIYAVFFLHLSALVLAELAYAYHSSYLEKTPLWVIEISILLPVLYAAFLGIESLGRFAQMVFFLYIPAILLAIIGLSPEIDWNNFKPVLENGLGPVLQSGLLAAPWRAEVFMLAMLYPYLNQKKEAKGTAVKAVLLVAVFTFLEYAVIIGTLTAPVVSNLTSVAYATGRHVFLGLRYDIVVSTVYLLASIIKLGLFFYAASTALKTTFTFNNPYYALLVSGTVVFLISDRLYGITAQLYRVLYHYWIIYGLTAQLIIPAILLLIAIWGRKKEVEPDER